LLPERFCERQIDSTLDDLGYQHETNIRVAPSYSRAVSESVPIQALHHFVRGPYGLMIGDGGVIIGKVAIVREARLVTQKLAQSENTFGKRSIQIEPTVAH